MFGSSSSLLPMTFSGAYPPVDAQVSPVYQHFINFQETQFWQLTVEPFHRRVIAPLRLSDYLLIFVGVLASYAIKRSLCRYQNFYAKPLGMLGGACCLGIVYHIVDRHINQHFNEIARTSLQHLRTEVTNAMPHNTEELNRLVVVLQGHEFDHLAFDSLLASILEETTTFIKDLEKVDLEQGILQQQQEALLVKIDTINIP